jgi:PKD repeat protein
MVFINESLVNDLYNISWIWDFDDVTYSVNKDPENHGYFLAGDYDVTLIAMADNNCSDTLVQTVSVGTFPIAAITSSGNPEFCQGDSIILSNTYNPSYNYQWQIGGANITGADSSKILAQSSGNYCVEVTNPIGNCTSVSDTLEISVLYTPLPP